MIANLRRLPLLEIGLVTAAAIVLTVLGLMRQDAEKAQAPALDSYSSYDARSGGYRAWYELLQREGVRVERFEAQPPFLDRGLDTLVWSEPVPSDPRQTSNTPADIRALEDWIKAGGRFVYLGHDDSAARKRLLKLPLSTTPGRKAGGARVAPALRALGIERVVPATPLRWKLRADLGVLLSDRAGALLVRYPYGKGEVVALIDETPFTNGRLASGDHARLAYVLARPHSRDGRVAFDEAAHGYLVPEHWWAVMPRPLVIAIGVAAFALLIAFAGAAIRLGPPLVPPKRIDATSGEFIESMAALFERGRAAHKALDDALRSTRRVVSIALGVPDDAPAAELAAHIENPELRHAYEMLVAAATLPRPNDAALVRGIELAQALRKEFIAHGRPRY
jgi:hypothetical protein